LDIGTLTGAIELDDELSPVLTIVSSSLHKFADVVTDTLGVAGIAAAAFTTVVFALGGAIVALGEKGSTLTGVENAFDRLAESAGTTGDVLRGSLTEGVRGTVDDMVLMQSTTRLLGSGMKLTSDQAKLMGQVSRELGKATGTDAAGGLQILSGALTTGRVRSLQAQIGVIDLKGAEEELAKSLGVTRDQLNTQGKLHADRIAILKASEAWVNKVGVSELSFKERIQQTTVAMQQWGDNLAKSVASSPHVLAAYDAIKAAIEKTFGGDSQRLLDSLVDGINRFADAVTKFGPSFVSTIGTVKNALVSVWEWLSNLNDRFHITDTIVAGVKTAWTVLQKAFLLVRDAVNAVIGAWESMPGWLQELTIGSLKLGAGLAVTAMAINATAAPIASLISKLDLTINIVGNLSGALVASEILWKNHASGVLRLVEAYTRLATTIKGFTVVQAASDFATRAMAQGQIFLSSVITATSGVLTTLSSRLGITAAATYVSATASGVATAAKGLLNAAVLALTINYNVLITRLGATSVSLGLSTVATRAATIGMTALGTAMLAVNYVLLPLLAAWAGWKIGPIIGDWLGLSDAIERASLRLQRWLGLIDRSTTDQDIYNAVAANTARRTGETTTTFDAAADAAKRLRDNLSGATLANEVEKLRVAFVGLTAEQKSNIETMDRVGQQAEMLRQQGGKLHPELKTLADRWVEHKKAQDAAALSALNLGENFVNTGSKTAELDKKVKSLSETIRGSSDEVKAFDQAFAKLNPTELANYDIQQRLIPLIEKRASSGVALTAAMEKEYDAAIENQAAHQALANTTFKASGYTLDYIETQKDLGVSEVMLAGRVHMTGEQLKKYITILQEVKNVTEEVRAVEDKFFARMDELTDIDNIRDFREQIDFVANSLNEADDRAKEFDDTMEMIRGDIDAVATRLEKAADESKSFGESVVEGFRSGLAGIGDAILHALEGGGDIVKSIGSAFGKSFTEHMFGGTKFTSMITSKFGDALGGMVNAILPGLGAILGPLLSKIGDLFKRAFGGPSAKELAGRSATDEFTTSLKGALTVIEKIEVQQLVAAGGSQKWATLIVGVRDAYVAAGRSVADAESAVNRLLAAEKQGPEAVRKIQDEINAVTEAAEAAADAAAKLTENLAGAQTGFATALGVTSDAYKKLEDDQMSLTKAVRDYNDLDPKNITAESAAAARKEILGLSQSIEDQQRIIAATGIHSQAAADAVAASLAGIIAANVKAGMSFIDAVRAVGPSVEGLAAQMEHLGYTGGAAFDLILRQEQLATDAVAGPALTALEGYTAGLKGLSDAGLLNQEMFAGLAQQISGTAIALMDQGFASSDIMIAMRGDLQTLWEMEQKYGYSVDDSTQALIDQGVQSGLIGEQAKTDNQKILDVLVLIAEALGATIPAGLDAMGGKFHTMAETAVSDLGVITEAADNVASDMVDRFQMAGDEIHSNMSFNIDQVKDTVWQMSDETGHATDAMVTHFQAAGTKIGEVKSIIAKPITIKIGWDIADYPNALGPGGGRATQADLEDFLARNPGDEHRFETASRNITDPNLPGYGTAPGMAGGGTVYAASGWQAPWVPSGTDTVPAMLTPGEVVTPKARVSDVQNDNQSDVELLAEIRAFNGKVEKWMRMQPTLVANAVRSGVQIGMRK